MNILPPRLYNRCLDILTQCDEFASDDSLRAVFARADLQSLQSRLPEATSVQNRISKTLAYLEQRYLSDRRSALLVFTIALRERRHPDEELYSNLGKVCFEIEQALNEVEFVDVPFVVVAMTQDEATDLFAEKVFNDPNVPPAELDRFRQFKAAFEQSEFENILSHYGENREKWRLHTDPEDTVEEIVLEIIEYINQYRREKPGIPSLRAKFFCAEFFGNQSHERHQLWDDLRQLGCIFIVDAVSTFHPILRRLLLQSTVLPHERAAMLMLSPVNARSVPANQLLEELADSEMEMVYSWFRDKLHELYEVGVGDLHIFQRRLITILPQIADIVQDNRSHPDNRKLLRDRLGTPRGMHKLVLGHQEKT